MFRRIAHALLGPVKAGACVPRQGDYCGCKTCKGSVLNACAMTYNCYGNCVLTTNRCLIR